MEGERKTEHVQRRALVTGATGFLGRYTVSELVKHDYEVIANGRNYSALDAIQQDGVSTLHADLEELAETSVNVESVIHAAALSSPWGAKRDFVESNVLGTKNVIDFCERNEVQRLVFVSSPSVYTALEHQYKVKEDSVDINNRLNHYIATKIHAEQLLKDAKNYGRIPELVIIRPRGLIGIGDPSLMPRLMRANDSTGIPLFNNGENFVDLTCVENVAHALRLSLEKPEADGGTFNITNGEPQKFGQLIELFFAEIGQRPRFRPMNFAVAYAAAMILEKTCSVIPGMPEPALTKYTVATLAFSQTLDISEATTKLGYKPVVSLEEGMQKYASHIGSV